LAYHTAFIVVKMCKLKRQVEITPNATTLSMNYQKNVLSVTFIGRQQNIGVRIKPNTQSTAYENL